MEELGIRLWEWRADTTICRSSACGLTTGVERATSSGLSPLGKHKCKAPNKKVQPRVARSNNERAQHEASEVKSHLNNFLGIYVNDVVQSETAQATVHSPSSSSLISS